MEAAVQGQSKCWQLSKNLRDCLTELYDRSLWTDVKFRCKDHDENGKIYAHKIVLAARSSVFQAMFFGQCSDGKDEVHLDQAETKTLDVFLRYIYSDTVNLTEETASSVLEMTHYYQITSLVQVCAEYLTTTITSENACGTLTLAMFYELTTLRDACCTFIDRNANKVLNSEGFLELSDECLTYILKGDTFYTGEDNIFIKAEKWSKTKLEKSNLEQTGPNIRKTLGASFYYLRLPTMTYQTLMSCSRKKSYFSVEEYEDIVDFINKIPDSSVQINSCVARLPTSETLALSREILKTNIFDSNDSISTSFQISVSRDITLTNFFLAKIQKCSKYEHQLYTNAYSQTTSIYEPSINNFFRQNNSKALKIIYPSSTKQVQTLQQVLPKALPDDLDIAIYGNFKVTRQKEKEYEIKVPNSPIKTTVARTAEHKNDLGDDTEDDEVTECENDVLKTKCKNDVPPPAPLVGTGGNREETDDNSSDKFIYSDGDDDSDKDDEEGSESIIYEQDFKLQSTGITQRMINLTKPLTLTKAASPYTVEMTLKYSCKSCIKMIAQCTNDTKSVRSKHGHVHIYNINNQGGIRSLGFENISNRE
ncbi:uncharacterized protein LOC123524307 [Mercenaria mercenaria]|uniref:uncharacterized protein LOC123524307 n=1 Tax=Mercenaria mercenaria TaxID=6596 RepID=UPI00234F400F|nr:uncharacterized protein LOC123524307 [Mercenaria mercenaria]XP_053394973.1 uncharacterized protein LOC123524307 [Mercenaria mercenaria]